MGNDADDLYLFRFRCAQADEDLLADGRLAGECLGGECVIDDYAVASGEIVLVSKGASREQRRAHGFEVTGKNDLKIGCLKAAWVVRGILRSPANGTEFAGQREWE